MKVGVFLSRMQPIHNAHLWMIENVLKENDEVLIIIGSANKAGIQRNPFNIELRKQLLIAALKERFGKDYKEKIKVIELPDWSSEENNNDTEWGRLIYYTVVGNIGVKEFSYYCSENSEMIKGWFEDSIKERINFRFFSRNNEFNGLSATKIRKAILEENVQFIKDYCPKCVFQERKKLKEIIKSSKQLA